MHWNFDLSALSKIVTRAGAGGFYFHARWSRLPNMTLTWQRQTAFVNIAYWTQLVAFIHSPSVNILHWRYVCMTPLSKATYNWDRVQMSSWGLRVLLMDPTTAALKCWDLKSQPSNQLPKVFTTRPPLPKSFILVRVAAVEITNLLYFGKQN